MLLAVLLACAAWANAAAILDRSELQAAEAQIGTRWSAGHSDEHGSEHGSEPAGTATMAASTTANNEAKIDTSTVEQWWVNQYRN